MFMGTLRDPRSPHTTHQGCSVGRGSLPGYCGLGFRAPRIGQEQQRVTVPESHRRDYAEGHAFWGGTMAENPGARTPGNLRFVPTERAWATSPRYRLSIHWFAARPACGFPWLRCRGSHARENRQSPQSRMDRGLQDPYRIM